MSSNPGDGKPGARSAESAPPVQFGVESVKRPDITGSLDFTALTAAAAVAAPAPAAAPKAAATPKPAAAPKPAASSKPAEAPKAAPAAVPRPAASTAAKPEVRPPAKLPVADRLEPPIRDAALLYAKGQAPAAKSRLEKALEGELSGAALARGWLMLLELHQVLRERAPFEARSIAFAEKFLRSAPVWREPEPAGAPASQAAGGAVVALTGKLSAESAAQMHKLREMALKNRALRLDVSRLQGADGAGCRVLVDLLQVLRRAGVALVLDGDAVLLGALGRATRAGARDVDPALWKLRLELLQWQGRQDEFDALAVDYAVTYEESPPSFEPPPARAAAPASGTASTQASHGEEIELPGELAGAIDELLQRVEAAAALQETVTLACARTTRVDLAAAGALRELAARLDAGGRRIEFRHPTAMVSALLDASGVAAHARVVERS